MMEKKSNILEVFKKWKTLVKNQTNDFYIQEEIKRTKVISRTPKENELAQWINHIIPKKGIAMLHHASLS